MTEDTSAFMSRGSQANDQANDYQEASLTCNKDPGTLAHSAGE